MEHEYAKGAYGGTEVHVGLEFHKIIDYDRRLLRRAMAKGAGEIRKEARRQVARRVISAPGENPGLQTGTLRRAIGVVSKGTWGGWIKIGVKKPPQMKEFYPAFLFYGVKKLGKIQRLAPGEGRGSSNRRRRGDRAALVAERRANTGFFVAPRNNYMVDALNAKRDVVKQIIQDALKNALVPR